MVADVVKFKDEIIATEVSDSIGIPLIVKVVVNVSILL